MMRSQTGQNLIPLSDLEDGKCLEGDSKNLPSPPDDFDMTKFHRGRLFFREHIFSCTIGMFFSVIIGLCMPNLLEVLAFTEKSNTPKKAFKRYIHTFQHISLWHYGDVWQKGTEAHKSILSVRDSHQKVAQNIENHRNKNENTKFLSQYDMGIVQSGFMGFIIMYSHHIGIKCSPSDLDDYVYFWYGIGHLLGIKKKYNICAYGSSQAFSFCKDIEDILFQNLQNPPSKFVPMAMAVIKAFQNSSNFTLMTLPVITGLSLDAMSRKHAQLTKADSIRFYIWKFIFCLLRRFVFFRKFLCMCVEKVFDLSFTSI